MGMWDPTRAGGLRLTKEQYACRRAANCIPFGKWSPAVKRHHQRPVAPTQCQQWWVHQWGLEGPLILLGLDHRKWRTRARKEQCHIS